MKKRNRGRGEKDSFLRVLFKAFGGLLKLIIKVIVMLGLWVPILYALFGVILHYTLGFDPFDFSTFSTFYIVGGIVCIVIVVIISAYNVLINPLKRAFGKKKNDPAEEGKAAKELQPPLTEGKKKKGLFFKEKKKESAPFKRQETDYKDAQSLDWIPAQEKDKAANGSEKPDIYFSVLKPDILVHEYHDRFELYRVDGNKLLFIGTEYK